MNKQTNLLLYFLILEILVIFVKSSIKITNINLNNDNIRLDGLKNETNFQVEIESSNRIKNYIKIIAEGANYKEITNHTNHIISFYQQDSNFKNRKQLSQSLTGRTIMWLKKEQLKNIFYFSVECSDSLCDYSIDISQEDEIKLIFGEQLSYYVTEENRIMNFIIQYESTILTNDTISIWARGYKDIISKLNGIDNYYKNSEYNAYSIILNENDNINLEFIVEGKIGDLINVGALYFKQNISETVISDNGVEIAGFLKKDKIEKNCFKFPKERAYSNKLLLEYDNIYNNLNERSINDEDYYIYCLEIRKKSIEYSDYKDDLFYVGRYGYYRENFFIDKFSYQKIGEEIRQNCEKNQSVGVFALKPTEDFQYLTFHASIYSGKIDLFIYNCDTYPLCEYDSNINEKLIPIQNMQDDFSFTYSKEELSDITTTSKKQKIIMFKCEEIIDYDECIVDINIFQNNNNLLLKPYINYYYYSKENNENNFTIVTNFSRISSIEVFTIFEIFSGVIKIKYEEKDPHIANFENNNKNVYIFNSTDKYYISFKIEAIQSSFYRVNYYYKVMVENYGEYIMFSKGANYLFNFEKKPYLDIYPLHFLELNSEYTGEYFDYLSFYPINCEIEIEDVFLNKTSNEKISYKINQFYNFYQDIWSNYDKYLPSKDLTNIGYRITNKDNKNDKCMFNISIFKIMNDTIDKENNGLFLENHFSQKFLFNKEVNSLKFSYPHIVKDKDIIIKIKVYDKEKYKMNIYFDSVKSKTIYDIKKDKKIVVKAEEWKNICIYEQQICKISFRLTSLNTIEESFVEVVVISEDDNKSKSPISASMAVGILFIIIGIIGIIIAIAFYLRYKKRKDLLKEVAEIPETKGSLL